MVIKKILNRKYSLAKKNSNTNAFNAYLKAILDFWEVDINEYDWICTNRLKLNCWSYKDEKSKKFEFEAINQFLSTNRFIYKLILLDYFETVCFWN